MGDYSVIETRLRDCSDDINRVQTVCRTPSVSYGVLHEGAVLLKESRGLRDIECTLNATTETAYMLSSCSKMFLVAAIGICVDEGKMSWDDLICKHIPEFNPQGDPEIRTSATIRNALSHTTGLGKQQPLLFGPHSAVTATKASFLSLVNEANTADDLGQRFRRQVYLYNNLACGLATLALESATGENYADFVQKRILQPLGMTQTIITRHRLATETNLAYGYAMMESDGKFVRIETSDYTNEHHSPVLSVTGVYSSVSDLLKWAASLFEACDGPVSGNPLRQVQMIWQPQSDLGDGTSYCMGFYRGTLPTASFGVIGLNNKLRDADGESFSKYIIGRESSRREFIGHSGNWNGYTAAIYLFPESKSAVVALANAMDLGDAADFTAKILTQALFDTKPKVNILEFAKKESELFIDWFQKMQDDWCRERNTEGYTEGNLEDYVGTYTAFQTSIEIFVDPEIQSLTFTINGNTKSQCTLEFYDEDAYSFLPRTRDDWLRNAMLDWDYYGVGIFYFMRKNDGKVDRFCWMYEISEPSGWFYKTEKSRAIATPPSVEADTTDDDRGEAEPLSLPITANDTKETFFSKIKKIFVGS